jgi:hypothetical protein
MVGVVVEAEEALTVAYTLIGAPAVGSLPPRRVTTAAIIRGWSFRIGEPRAQHLAHPVVECLG